ncbi:MAG: radical SAM protein [Chitinivibrionales bacterium]|nr:radical SAM protein [Chitinivibrionales bacterium]
MPLGYKIVMTCDRTMASSYHGLMFLGFSACLPQGILPDCLYYPLFCPNARADKRGALVFANYGTRKIEAALLAGGFAREDIIVAHPDHLHEVIDENTKIVSISSNDPLGIGPATSTFVELWGGEGRMAVKLREVLVNPAIRKHKPKLLLGGPGAWQFAVHPDKQRELGIDCVVVGEGDATAPGLFKDALGGKSLEPLIYGAPASDDDIADIVGGSTIGIIEATRGCARSCAFCIPSVKKVRSRPLERILNEVQTNLDAGNTGALLHGEDILLYRSDGLRVNSDAVIHLFETVRNYPGVQWVGASHASLSSALSSPATIEGIARVLKLGSRHHPATYFQVGIETGSSTLIRRHMKGKVYPYDPKDWPRVVHDGFALLHENHIVCTSTIILGLPGERKQDIEQTTKLIRSLRPYQSLIVPLLFTPMETTRLEYAAGLYKKDLTARHHELLATCWDHNLHWLPALWANYSHKANPLLKGVINFGMRLGMPIVKNRIHRYAEKHKVRQP